MHKATPTVSKTVFIVCLAASTLAAQEFPRATPESQGLRSDTLRDMSAFIRANEYDIRSVLVLRNGKIVLEWLGGDVTRDHHHNVFSITKSVVATLAGIAIEKGIIPSESSTLAQLFPRSRGLADDPVKGGIQVGQLLTMRSGFPCSRANQTTGPERKLFVRIHDAPDRLALSLDELQRAATPGASFVYNNIDPALVLAAIEENSHQKALAFADRHLFSPLEFKNARWLFPDRKGRVPGGYGLRLRAIDLAKIGQLYLQHGQWNGKPLLSSKWVRHATSDIHGDGYGCFWWVDSKSGSYSAKGVRGQRLVVHPDLSLVYVILADLPPAKVRPVTNALGRDFILKAIASNQTLPDDADANQRLADELAAARQYRPASRQSLPAFRTPQL